MYHSRSDPVPQPRAAQDTVADLHALLHAAAVPGPYVLAVIRWVVSMPASMRQPIQTTWSGSCWLMPSVSAFAPC
jgi:hypothetical protein